ncbi:MAG: flavodoxin/nitric oxide synthase [Propionicimonas sp.]
MQVLMVIESMFGNTRQLGQQVAAGLTEGGATVELVGVDDAPATVEGIDLLMVGAPTHNRGLSTPASRAQAAKAGASSVRGVREWLESVAVDGVPRVEVFDTSTSHSWLSGSAAKAAVKLLARRSPATPAAARTFLVQGTQGPLQPGELDAALAWGRELAA